MSIKNCIFFLVITLVISSSLPSCHFGASAEEMVPTFADKKRQIEYSLTVGLPFASSDVYSIEDCNLRGLRINWNEREALALFGSVFEMEADTLRGSAAIPSVKKLSFDARRDDTTGYVGSFKAIDFKFESWAKHGEGENFAVTMPVVYPYSKVLDKNGSAPKCNIDSLEFNFNGQDGRLQQLRDSFFVAIGYGTGVVNGGRGTITVQDEEYVKLTPKFAIVRIALTFPAELPYTLNEYIRSRSFSETVRYIDNISITNENDNASGFNKMVYNLNTGEMKASQNALPMLVLRSRSAFTNLTDLPYENQISLEPVGGSQISWGTMLYVAVPCPDGGQLGLDALIDVTSVRRSDNVQEHYYGRLAPVTLQEGSYYLTSSVELKETEENLEKAEVLQVPEASDFTE